MPNATTEDHFITLQEAARLFRISESGFRKWLGSGLVPADAYFQVRPRGRLRFRRERLEAWARSRT